MSNLKMSEDQFTDLKQQYPGGAKFTVPCGDSEVDVFLRPIDRKTFKAAQHMIENVSMVEAAEMMIKNLIVFGDSDMVTSDFSALRSFSEALPEFLEVKKTTLTR